MDETEFHVKYWHRLKNVMKFGAVIFVSGIIWATLVCVGAIESEWLMIGIAAFPVGILMICFTMWYDVLKEGGTQPNKRLTTTPESKRLAESGLRGQIHRWRDEAYLAGKTTVRKRITTLTMAEIAAVYPRVKQISVYDVEFDFTADDKYERL